MKKLIICFIVVLFYSFELKAQFIEDALRYSSHNGTLGARAGGLGISYLGVADDNSALIVNPAGLSLIANDEFSFGFGFDTKKTKTTLFNSNTDLKSTNAYLTNFSITSPFKTKSGNGALSVGYYLESNFNNNFESNYFNPNSTYINYIAKNGPKNPDDNMVYHLWLSGKDLNTPIKDSLLQNNFVKESGGIHSLSGGFGYDVNDVFSIGFNIIGKFGSYNYIRDYSETDVKNKYYFNDEINYRNVDLNKFTLSENIKQSFAGISATFGLQARIENFIRLGATISLPTLYSIDEDFSQEANAMFDNGEKVNPPYRSSGSNSYKIYTPFKFALGGSVHFFNLTLATALQYVDQSQLEFSDGPSELNNINTSIIKSLTGVTTFGIGAEYEIPMMPIVVRASYDNISSPYLLDANTLNIINFGVGFYLAPNIKLDFLCRFSENKEIRNYYSDYTFNLNYSPLTIQTQLIYRF